MNTRRNTKKQTAREARGTQAARSTGTGTQAARSTGTGSARRAPRHASSTVVPQVEDYSRRSGNKTASRIPASHRKPRAHKGYVNQIAPAALSGESATAYARRMNRRDFSAEIKHKSRLRRVGFVVGTLVAVAVVAVCAAYFAFFASLDAKLSAGSDANLASVLVSPEQDKPFYTLLTADLNSSNANNNIDAALLVRCDEATKQLTLIAVPSNLALSSNNTYTSLSNEFTVSGATGVVKAVSSLFGVDIAHYLHITQAGFERVIDNLGGIDITVEQTVDDPRAGSVYLSAGEQTLNGKAAAVYVAAHNYKDATQTQMTYQLAFARALTTAFFANEGGFTLDANLDSLASYLVTDMSARELQTYQSKLAGTQGNAVYTATLDGYEQTTTTAGKTSEKLYYTSTSSVTSLMEKVEAGEDPSQSQQQNATVSVDKESFEITVRNGSGITGGATTLAQILTDAGYTVAETGNADSYVYTETLVIYLDSEYKEACEAVVQTLGLGRVVNGVNGYTFDTEVLVVLGSDWKPLS